MSSPVVLIVSANRSQFMPLSIHLKQAGYETLHVAQGESILKMLAQVNPRLLLVDWDLPDLSALAVIRAIRADHRFSGLPVILTGREISAENKILALEAGADLCLEAIVSPREFVARVQALMRRANGAAFCR